MAKSGMSESDVESEDGKTPDATALEENQPEEASVTVVSKPEKTSTPTSIVIQSLIKNLCGVYEPEERNASKLYNLICDKLFEMSLIDESYDMIEFEGMRNQYQRAFHHLLTSARGEEAAAVPLRPMWLNNDITNEWSHYHREFDEVSFIAGGGFGHVYRVKHKLDGTEYAVKKIFIRSEGIKSVMNYLSEVKTFASLNHSNIVQYKAAWLEMGASNEIIDHSNGDSSYEYTEDHSEASYTKESNQSTNNHLESGYIYPEVIADTETTFHKADNGDSSDFRVSFERSRHFSYSNSQKQRKRTKRSSISEGGNAICTVEDIRRLQGKHPRWATLFIQMALCQTTLKQWLETRNMADNEAALVPITNQSRTNSIMEILKSLLKGLEYIHYKRIVHHDIKPSNIFMQLENDSLLVQLGDFGLACPLQSTKHSLAFGTKLYAAPEQLSGKCDPKSDMYSLGIVVFELAETFRTDMERVHNITNLRKGSLPHTLCNQQPQLANIINQLVVRNPNERPSASALLKRINVDVVESAVVRDLQSKIVEKDDEIMRLTELLKTAGVTNV